MTNIAVSSASPASLLSGGALDEFDAAPHLSGFGGFHGGLALGVLVNRMRRESDASRPLRSVSARFHRPLEGTCTVEQEVLRESLSTTVHSARIVGARGLAVEGSAILGAARTLDAPAFEPQPPDAPSAEECETFAIPAEFVPITAYLEIRPVGPNRPYAGGAAPELIAWIRMTEDEHPPDTARFVFLMDALAPSYAAVLTRLIFVPTVEIVIRPAPALEQASSPWMLVRAQTRVCSAGWAEELVEAWGPDGSYLGSAQQLRVLRSASA